MTQLSGYYLNTNAISSLGDFLKDSSNFLRISNIDGYINGGTVGYCGNSKYHKFTSNGQFTTSIPLINAEILVIGGGGKGGGSASYYGGGGGGGGQIKHIYKNLSPGTYNASIGTGSNQSSFYNIVALPGQDGSTYLSGLSGSGFNGGSNISNLSSGGGGGDTSLGKNASSLKGGDGGNGQQLSLTCSYVNYAGGGGGGSFYGSGHGIDGGGEGGSYPVNPTVGIANTGGGGGGGSKSNGADGGSGIVVVKYQYIDGSIYIPPVNPSIGYWTYDKWSFENTLAADPSSLQNITWDVSSGSEKYASGKVGNAIIGDPSSATNGYFLYKYGSMVSEKFSWSMWLYWTVLPGTDPAPYHDYGFWSSQINPQIGDQYLNFGRSGEDIDQFPNDFWVIGWEGENGAVPKIAGVGQKVTITPNTWTHIVLTYDTFHSITLYKNNVKLWTGDMTDFSSFTINSNGMRLGSGKISGTLLRHFGGKIDQFYFYPNHILTTAEISALWNGGSGI